MKIISYVMLYAWNLAKKSDITPIYIAMRLIILSCRPQFNMFLPLMNSIGPGTPAEVIVM